MASHQIAIQVIHFSFLPAMAVAEAGSVLIGSSGRSRPYELVPKVARLAMGITAVYAGAWSVVLVRGFAARGVGVHQRPRSGADERWAAAYRGCLPDFDAANIVARCALRGAGDVRFAAVVGVLTAWLCTPTLAWLLGRHYQLGARGGWIGLCLEIFASSSLLWWRLARGGWRPSARLARESLAARSDRPEA